MKTPEEIEKQLRERIGEDISRESWGIAAHDCLRTLLMEKWLGKKINARIADQFKQRFLIQVPEEQRANITIRYYSQYSWCGIWIYGIGPWKEYNERADLQICYDSQMANFEIAAFDKCDTCHGDPAKKRNEQRIKLCQNGELATLASLIALEAETREARETLTEYGKPGNEIRYFAEELAGGKK